jgi:RNA polymerase primary sigma factor
MRNLDKRACNTYYTTNAGTLGSYLNEISKYKILTDIEIRKEIEKSKKGNKKSTDKIVNCNQRFVFSLAKRFSKGDDNLLSDLINEANIGLIKSIKFFDTEKDNSFLTYSVYWMQRQIYLYLTFTNPIIKISNKAKTLRVSEIKNRFYLINGRYPSSEEVKIELKEQYGIDILNQMDVYQLTTTSIDDTTIEEKSGYTPNYSVNFTKKNELASEIDHEEDYNSDYSKALLSTSMGILSDREKKVIELLYGMSDYREYKIQEVAKKLDISPESVRLINIRALKKLKDEIVVAEKSI